MIIETKFNIGDKVHFVHKRTTAAINTLEGKVVDIQVIIYSHRDKPIIDIIYKLFISLDSSTDFKWVREQLIAKTKQELIDSLTK